MGFSGFHCQSRHCLPQSIALVFYWLDPFASNPLLFRWSDARRRCPPHRSPALWLVIFYFLLWLVILFGLGWGKILEISVFLFFFYFFCCGLVVVVAVTDSRGDCGWWCGCFLGSGLYYFIVRDILFYCDIYIILLRWKLK